MDTLHKQSEFFCLCIVPWTAPSCVNLFIKRSSTCSLWTNWSFRLLCSLWPCWPSAVSIEMNEIFPFTVCHMWCVIAHWWGDAIVSAHWNIEKNWFGKGTKEYFLLYMNTFLYMQIKMVVCKNPFWITNENKKPFKATTRDLRKKTEMQPQLHRCRRASCKILLDYPCSKSCPKAIQKYTLAELRWK